MPSEHIKNLTDKVTSATTVVKSATVLISGIRVRIEEAVAAAVANGATEAELTPVSELANVLGTESDALSAAVVANTPGSPTPPVDPAPDARRR